MMRTESASFSTEECRSECKLHIDADLRALVGGPMIESNGRGSNSDCKHATRRKKPPSYSVSFVCLSFADGHGGDWPACLFACF